MANYSISGSKGDDTTKFTEGTLAPNAGAVEIRINDASFTSRNEVVVLIERLVRRMLTKRQPRPGKI